MIVLVVHIVRATVLEGKGHPVVSGDHQGIDSSTVSLEGMKPVSRKIHVLGGLGSIQEVHLDSKFPGDIRPKMFTAPALEQFPERLVSETSNHL